jgi:hypothetical protein
MRSLNHLILLTGQELTAEDRRLMAFASSMGVASQSVSSGEGSSFPQRILDEFQPGTFCLAVGAETLAHINDTSTSRSELQRLIDEYSAALLVFGCTDSEPETNAISWLTSGAISGIISLPSQSVDFELPREAISFSKQLGGLSFSGVCRQLVSTFTLSSAATAAEVIMTANQRPVFVQMNRGSCELFLVSTALPDLDEPLTREHGIEEHYDELIPVMIFLRHCFGESCWHGIESTARLIIDDPLLSERYGFLDYGILTESMQRARYGTSMAFIPWNYWRTSRRNTERLAGESSRLSICVHGCDHTNKEFEARDAALLGRKAGLALRRMESLRKRTGAVFEPVMVFPQGRFSRAAIMALRDNHYLAAVNSTCFPQDVGRDDLKVGDFLRPAITRYNGFPIFLRHYPRRLFDFAFDLFLGRPALIVAHHDYFREGCRALEDLVAELYQQEPDLSWPTLTTQLMRNCRMRNLSNGSVEVQFFTRQFQFANRELTAGHFLLSKYEPDPVAIEGVLVDGASVPFSVENGFLKLEVNAEPGQVRNVEVVDREQPRQSTPGFGVAHNARVLLRRGLSEFRDNTLARHVGLLEVAQSVVRRLKVTGDS